MGHAGPRFPDALIMGQRAAHYATRMKPRDMRNRSRAYASPHSASSRHVRGRATMVSVELVFAYLAIVLVFVTIFVKCKIKYNDLIQTPCNINYVT